MLQRTNAKQVVPVYLDFVKKYETPISFTALKVTNPFTKLGLAWRYKHLRELAVSLSERTLPTDKNKLMELPGIGEYIAAAYRSLHLEERDFIIDSNVVRLYGRFFGFETDGETRRKKWFMNFAEALTPVRIHQDYNYGLLDFTRNICCPRPNCQICLICKKCLYNSK